MPGAPFYHALRAAASVQPFCAAVHSMMAFRDAVLLLPAAAAAYGNDVLVHTSGGVSYTASRGDALRLLHDLGLHQQAAVYPRVANLINPITPLQVTRPLGLVFVHAVTQGPSPCPGMITPQHHDSSCGSLTVTLPRRCRCTASMGQTSTQRLAYSIRRCTAPDCWP